MGQQQSDITDRRRFHLIDAITLVAAAAVMLAAGRVIQWFWVWSDPVASYNPRELRLMEWSLAFAELCLVQFTVLIAQPTGRRRLRRGVPGLAVYLVVGLVLIVRATGWLTQALIERAFHAWPGIYAARWGAVVMSYFRDDLRREVSVGILASWLALALVYRWNPERAWDDRLGRLIGAFWMLFYLSAPLLGLLP